MYLVFSLGFEKSPRYSGPFFVAFLTAYGISAVCLKWFCSYLSQRAQQTSVGDTLPSKRNVMICVQQGSVLGCLFLLFVNDLALSVKYSNMILFSDDTAIYYSGKNALKSRISSLCSTPLQLNFHFS